MVYRKSINLKGNYRWKVAQAAEIRWWKRYLRGKPPEEYLSRKKAYWQKVLSIAGVTMQPGEAVLDAGCGPAGIFILLDQQRVDAVDPLLVAYESALPHFDPANYPWVRFFASPLEHFQPAGKYDRIFCLNVINHVADIDSCLALFADALQPGGELYLSVDAHNHRFMRWVFQRIPGDILHPHQYTLEEYEQKLTGRGWRLSSACLLKRGGIFNYWLLKAER